jgi:hypothetical protein
MSVSYHTLFWLLIWANLAASLVNFWLLVWCVREGRKEK